MPNENMQQPNTQGDKSAAALAFATILSEQLMPKQMPEEMSMQSDQNPMQGIPQTLKTAPGEEMPEGAAMAVEEKEPEMETRMNDMEKRMDMSEMEKKMDEKMETMKNEILDAIKESKEDGKTEFTNN